MNKYIMYKVNYFFIGYSGYYEEQPFIAMYCRLMNGGRKYTDSGLIQNLRNLFV